ncbi:MAG: ATP-binding protein [Ardenticatenia bacterium]|nr:MAG: ATP-binding protein [Ardenticatenia bacterium]
MVKDRRVLRIEGQLGPLQGKPAQEIEVRPLTIFIGKQGVGKSLVAQVLYFFENLAYLSKYMHAKKGGAPRTIIRRILDNLRGVERPFTAFVPKALNVTWDDKDVELAFHKTRTKRIIVPSPELENLVKTYLNPEYTIPRHGSALFVPAERIMYAHGTPNAWNLLSLPLTMSLFVEVMEEIGKRYDVLQDSPFSRAIDEIGFKMLKGRVRRWRSGWKWEIDSQKLFNVDMISAGQKANWPILVLARALPVWREENDIGSPFSLYVEEPESHLHPEAQVQMVHLLALLVRQGFRVVITTHSLTILYALNNLVLASRLGEQPVDGVPAPEVRLKPAMVSAYLFDERGHVSSLLDEQQGFIEETALAAIDAELSAEMNRIMHAMSQLETDDAAVESM